jgi:hypothetical protein
MDKSCLQLMRRMRRAEDRLFKLETALTLVLAEMKKSKEGHKVVNKILESINA